MCIKGQGAMGDAPCPLVNAFYATFYEHSKNEIQN